MDTKAFRLLPRNKFFELFTYFNHENKPECRAIAMREIDMTAVQRARESLSEAGVKPGYTAFVAKAAAQVLREMPNANRAAIEMPFYSRVYQFMNYDVSVAVERSEEDIGGAFAYTVYDTDKKSVNAMYRFTASAS